MHSHQPSAIRCQPTVVSFLPLPFCLLMFVLSGCQQMWDQASVRPYEEPQLEPTTGTLAVNVANPLLFISEPHTGLRNPLSSTSETIAAGRLAYRRYCWPCHGPKLDGNATVGASLPGAQLNLLAPRVVGMSDGEIFWLISKGSSRKLKPAGTTTTLHVEAAMSPPLGGTMTPTERWAVIVFIRAVQAGETKLTGFGHGVSGMGSGTMAGQTGGAVGKGERSRSRSQASSGARRTLAQHFVQ